MTARALFLVSTGRTGTTWLEHLYVTAGARAFHEPGPKAIRHLAHAYASGHCSDAFAQRQLRKWRSEAVANASTAPYVEASTLAYGLVRPILAAFPDAHVIHVVRDPLTFLRSGMNWGQYRSGGRILNLIPYRRLAAPHFARWYDLGSRLDWAKQDQFARLCWAWTAMNRASREQGVGSDRYSMVRYEDLFDETNSLTTLRALLAPIGLELSDAELETLRTTRVNEHQPDWYKPNRISRWPEWTADQLARAVLVCGDEAKRYGYDLVGVVAAARPDAVRS